MSAIYKRIRIIKIILLAFLCVTLAAGCTPSAAASPDESTVSEDTTEQEAVTDPYIPPEETDEILPLPKPVKPENANPLTGLEIAAQDITRRPVAVFVNNIKKALPQHGLSRADIIYECEAEGRITRLVALFQNPEAAGAIGSIRSARPVFIDIAMGHDALTMHYGGSTQAYDYIKENALLTLDGITGGWDGTLYYRDKSRIKQNGYEHSAMSSGERIRDMIAKLKKRGTRVATKEIRQAYNFVYTETPPAGKSATKITVSYTKLYNIVYDYNDVGRVYVRSVYGNVQKDAENDVSLKFRNIFVLQIASNLIEGDKLGRLDYSYIGSGSGKYYSDGVEVDIKWSKKSASSPFIYTTADGKPLSVNAGKTFVNIVPLMSMLKAQ